MKALLILICFFLTGCANESEPNNIAYVTALGVDKSEKNPENYDFTFQIAKPTQISGGASEQGGSGGEIIENITVEAPTIYAGIDNANFIVSKILSLSHIKLFVFSEEISREGLSDITEAMTRSEEIRPNVYLAVALSSAKEYLEAVKPSLEINPAKYYQAKFDKSGNGNLVRCTNNQFYFDLKSVGKNAVLPLANTIGKENNSQQGGSEQSQNSGASQTSGQSGSEPPKENSKEEDAQISKSSFEYKIKDYIAGQVAISEENESEIMGMALFRGDKMVGQMGSVETLIYNILTNEFSKGYITYSSEKTDTPITVLIRRNKKTDIDYDKKTHTAKLKVFLDGEFVSLPADYITEQDLKFFEHEVITSTNEAISEFLRLITKEYNTDILGIGSFAKRSFLTNKAFEKLMWNESFPYLNFDIETKFKVIRTGLTIREETE